MGKSLIKINKWLYPASCIYGAGVWLRNKLFDWGYYKERSFNLPVICIGNLTVGGTGKTPHTEYLIQLLHKSYQVAVLSRGYKRKSKGFVLAKADTPVRKIGDEPYQMKQKFPDIHMAVDADRCNGIEQLCKANVTPATDVILLDDAFLANVQEIGEYFRAELRAIGERHPGLIKEVRGLGLMIGCELTGSSKEAAAELLKRGVLVNSIGEHVLRFVPPLTITKAEIDSFMPILEDVLIK